MLPIKAVCDKRVRKNGNPVCIQYCYKSNEKTVLNTEIYIPIRYWNKRLRRVVPEIPPEYGNAETLNQEIQEMIRKVEDLVSIAIKKKENPLRFVKETFRPDLDIGSLDVDEIINEIKERDIKEQVDALDFFYQIEEYIKEKTGKTCADMPRIYRNMRDHLKDYELFRKQAITFNCLDYNFYEGLVNFLTYEYVLKSRKQKIVGLKTNTVGKTIKQLRTFLRDRIRKKIIPDLDMSGWTILEEEVDAVYCDWKEIAMIHGLDLSQHPHLKEYRDDFVLACMTGLRFSDFSNLDEYDIRNGMLYKKQEKSKHWVVIPLRPEALEILRRRFESGRGATSNAEFNRHIKTVAKLAGITRSIKHSYKKGNKNIVEVKPKCDWICSHTGRRSFCTNEFLAGTPVELIMKISGHKSIKDFYKYIRISPEEAAMQIRKIWLEKGQLSCI